MKFNNTPRIMLAATSSDSGKTTLTCGILQALIDRNKKVTAFKCGPDYIDPMFHSEVIGANSRNLDLFMLDENTVKYLLCKNSAESDISIMEGVMGYYDGVGGDAGCDASAYHLAKVTKTPVVLIVDVKGMSTSTAALIKGFQTYKEDSNICGVILNRAHPMSYQNIKQLIEKDLHVPVLGYLPTMQNCSLESRHLGLVTAAEVENLKEKTSMIAAQVQKTIDLDLLEAIANNTISIEFEPIKVKKLEKPVRIAIAKDKAFCFYYKDSLDLLEEMGAQLIEGSPLNDEYLPEDIDGIFFGGGYPEVYAKKLSDNQSFLEDLRRRTEDGLPCYAECGGFMYLHETMQDENGKYFLMAGVIKGASYRTDHLVRFGYITLTANKDNLLSKKDGSIKAHEFHHWDSTNSGDCFIASRPSKCKEWDCIISQKNILAGYPHMHFYSNPDFAYRFLNICLNEKEKRGRL